MMKEERRAGGTVCWTRVQGVKRRVLNLVKKMLALFLTNIPDYT